MASELLSVVAHAAGFATAADLDLDVLDDRFAFDLLSPVTSPDAPLPRAKPVAQAVPSTALTVAGTFRPTMTLGANIAGWASAYAARGYAAVMGRGGVPA